MTPNNRKNMQLFHKGEFMTDLRSSKATKKKYRLYKMEGEISRELMSNFYLHSAQIDLLN